jgi:hypothetical protein
MAEKAPEEASAAMRAMARTVRDMYIALCAEGFTATEALIIVGQMLRAAIDKGPQS